MRSRAEEAITSIQYMQSFAACSDLAELPELFQDSSRLPEAAVGLLFMTLTTLICLYILAVRHSFNLQAMSGRLLSLARDVSGARERAASASKLPSVVAKVPATKTSTSPRPEPERNDMSFSCLQGSIEHAASQLEIYRAMLEKEVITSFDKAVHQKDLGTMAECAMVMTEFERGDTALMQVRLYLVAICKLSLYC